MVFRRGCGRAAQIDQIQRVGGVAFDVAQIAFDEKRGGGIYERLIAELVENIENERVSFVVGPGFGTRCGALEERACPGPLQIGVIVVLVAATIRIDEPVMVGFEHRRNCAGVD